MFVLEMTAKLILWGMLLHAAFAQVWNWNQQKKALLQVSLLPMSWWFYDAFQNDYNDVQPTEVQPASAESSREAARSPAEPGSSREEKCKKTKC